MTQEDQASRRKLTTGYIMAACGFALLLIAAMNYIFGWKIGTPSIVIGIMFLGLGMGSVRKAKREMNSDHGTGKTEG